MGAHRVDHRFRQPQKHGFYQVLDEFSIPEAYLFSAMIQYFTEAELRYDPLLMYRAIRSAIGDVHISQKGFQVGLDPAVYANQRRKSARRY